MNSPSLFEEHLEAIEIAIARVCRDARLDRDRAEDFASSVRLSLLADDCAILRKFQGRSAMRTYLTIVVRRLLVDMQRSAGRWFASAEAKRRGDAAVLLERLMVRERRPFSEVVELVRRDHPDVSPRDMEEIAAALPERAPRPALVPVADDEEESLAGTSSAADRIDALDMAQRSSQANAAVQSAMASMTAEDRVILRLRFTCNASIAAISRSLGIEQRPLYRRIEALLAALRRALEQAGVDASSAASLIGAAGEPLDFGFGGKNGESHPSGREEGT
ncbi:MAG TPA: sigma-70 family RNA polymerase sigma factor [Thermoanaerobaculia bacterium]|jgi:RNA polymerase sigma factor (sigma-70 family)